MTDAFAKFTERSLKAMQYAHEEATRLEHNYIGTEHLLLGLLRVDNGVAAQVLHKLGFELEKVRRAVEFIIGRGHAQFAPNLGLTPRAKKSIQLAVGEAQQLKHVQIGTEHLLLGILREGEGVAVGVIESFGVSLDSVRSAIGEIVSSPHLIDTIKWPPTTVVAREREIERLLNVVLRRTRHNPVLVGGEGAGRMSVVHGLVQCMAAVELPIRLQFRRMLRLSPTSDLASIEATLNNARLVNAAVVVRDIDRLTSDGVELLTSLLAHDSVRMIGVTSPFGFETMVAEHPTFVEQVQPVLVEELSVADAATILRMMVGPLEEHHSVTISDDALNAAATVAHRYQPDQLLPGSALQLLDEAASLARGRDKLSASDVQAALQQLDVPAVAVEDADASAAAERLRSTFAPTIADVLVNTFATPGALLAYVSRGTHLRQFAQSLAGSLFISPSSVVELDLARAPWRLATYPPGRVWFPEDQRLADALRGNPRCVMVLSSANRASPGGLDLATHVLRTRHLTDPLGRRLDLSQAAIVVAASHGALVDPLLMELLPARLELTRAWAR